MQEPDCTEDLTERKLALRGIHTIGDIAAAPPSMLALSSFLVS